MRFCLFPSSSSASSGSVYCQAAFLSQKALEFPASQLTRSALLQEQEKSQLMFSLYLDHVPIPQCAQTKGTYIMTVSGYRAGKAASPKGKLRPATRKGMEVGQGKTREQRSSPSALAAGGRSQANPGVSAESNLTHQCYIEMSPEVQCRVLMNF